MQNRLAIWNDVTHTTRVCSSPVLIWPQWHSCIVSCLECISMEMECSMMDANSLCRLQTTCLNFEEENTPVIARGWSEKRRECGWSFVKLNDWLFLLLFVTFIPLLSFLLFIYFWFDRFFFFGWPLHLLIWLFLHTSSRPYPSIHLIIVYPLPRPSHHTMLLVYPIYQQLSLLFTHINGIKKFFFFFDHHYHLYKHYFDFTFYYYYCWIYYIVHSIYSEEIIIFFVITINFL